MQWIHSNSFILPQTPTIEIREGRMAGSSDASTDEDEINHFKAIPWCAKHLDAPNLIVAPAWSRQMKPRFEDAFMSTVVHTKDTIPYFVVFYPRPEDETATLPEIKAFITLGVMMSGYGGILHGGVVATILDEITSFITPHARMRDHFPGDTPIVTAYLNTRYLRPVVVPQTYLVTARWKKTEGRKTFLEAFIENEAGQRVAEADSLFVEIRSKI